MHKARYCFQLSGEWSVRADVRAIHNREKPLFLMSSPPCTMFSELTRLWNLKKMEAAVREQRMAEAEQLLSFGISRCMVQYIRGHWFGHEHPWRASSWDHPDAYWIEH